MKKYHCIVSLLFLLSYGLYSESVATLSAALDLSEQTGIQLVKFSKRVYNVAYDKEYEEYDYVYDAYDEPTFKDTANTGWVGQSSSENSKYSTYPLKG